MTQQFAVFDVNTNLLCWEDNRRKELFSQVTILVMLMTKLHSESLSCMNNSTKILLNIK